jgi:hypothetical protein
MPGRHGPPASPAAYLAAPLLLQLLALQQVARRQFAPLALHLLLRLGQRALWQADGGIASRSRRHQRESAAKNKALSRSRPRWGIGPQKAHTALAAFIHCLTLAPFHRTCSARICTAVSSRSRTSACACSSFAPSSCCWCSSRCARHADAASRARSRSILASAKVRDIRVGRRRPGHGEGPCSSDATRAATLRTQHEAGSHRQPPKAKALRPPRLPVHPPLCA